MPASPTTRITIPSNSSLLSVEGTSGAVVTDAAGNPTGFSGTPQTKILEAVIRLSGPGQSVNPSALSAAGDIGVTLGNGVGNLTLDVSGTQVTRLRAKGALSVVNGTATNVYSHQGDLRAASLSNITTGTRSGNVTTHVENASDGFYSVPLNKVKIPTTPTTPSSGVYVMNNAGVLTYYDMDFSAYDAARRAGTLSGGTSPASIPGAALTTNSSGSPKFTLTFSKDIQNRR